MIIRSLTLVWVPLLLLTGLRAQNVTDDNTHLLSGRLTDAVTGQGIAYASVYCGFCDFGGTVTNELGQFVISAPTPAADIRIDHLMYGTLVTTLRSPTTEVTMTAVAHDLPEVVIDGTEALSLVRQLYDKSVTGNEDFFRGEGFYRQSTRVDTVYTELFEYFVKVKYNNRGISDWKLVTGRFAVNPLEGRLTMDNQSYFTRGWKVYTDRVDVNKFVTPINPEAFPFYTYRIADRLLRQDGEVIAVTCEPTSEAPDGAIAAKLFVRKRDLQLLRAEYWLDTLGLEIPGATFRDPQLRANINFRVGEGGVSLMESMTTVVRLEYRGPDGVGRPLEVRSVYLNFPPSPMRGTSSGVASRDYTDLKEVSSKKYRPKWWAEHPAVAPTAVEKRVIDAFDRAGSFGNYFEGQ